MTSNEHLLLYFSYLQSTYPIPDLDSFHDDDTDDGSLSFGGSTLQKLPEIEVQILKAYCKLLSKLFSITVNDRSSVSVEKQSVILFSGAALLEFYTKVSLFIRLPHIDGHSLIAPECAHRFSDPLKIHHQRVLMGFQQRIRCIGPSIAPGYSSWRQITSKPRSI